MVVVVVVVVVAVVVVAAVVAVARGRCTWLAGSASPTTQRLLTPVPVAVWKAARVAALAPLLRWRWRWRLLTTNYSVLVLVCRGVAGGPGGGGATVRPLGVTQRDSYIQYVWIAGFMWAPP